MEQINKENIRYKTFILSFDKEKIDVKNKIKIENKTLEEDRIVRGIITTSDVDLDGDVILTDGMNTTIWQKNPLFCLEHNTDDIIGKGIGLYRNPDRIIVDLVFDTSEMAEKDYQLFKNGMKRTFSIGFLTIAERKPTADEVREYPGIQNVITKSLLLEVSSVSVPANPDAQAIETKSINETEEIAQEAIEQKKIEEVQTEVLIEKVDPEPSQTPSEEIVEVKSIEVPREKKKVFYISDVLWKSLLKKGACWIEEE